MASFQMDEANACCHFECYESVSEAFIKSAQPDEDATLENCKYLLLICCWNQGAGKASMCVRWMYSSFVPNPTQVTQGRKHFHRTSAGRWHK